jgi:hypothetical protein
MGRGYHRLTLTIRLVIRAGFRRPRNPTAGTGGHRVAMFIGNDDRLTVGNGVSPECQACFMQGSASSFRASSIFLDLDKLTSRY